MSKMNVCEMVAEVKDYSIRDIEALTEKQAAEIALETENFKGYQLYFVDFGGYFGYSVLVFADGHHIKYANDYELHHQGKSREELRKFYLKSLSKKLFTENELKTVASYDDKKAKEYYIRNYYGMRRDYISMFFCGPDEEREKLRKKTEKMLFSPVFFAYYDKKNADFVKHGAELLATLEKAEPQNDNGDFDVCSCFGDCSSVKNYEDINELFTACKFSDVQQAAYMAARREYGKKKDYEPYTTLPRW